jgi:hypothetical protein
MFIERKNRTTKDRKVGSRRQELCPIIEVAFNRLTSEVGERHWPYWTKALTQVRPLDTSSQI